MRRTLPLVLACAALLAAATLDSPCRAGSAQLLWRGMGLSLGRESVAAGARVASPRESGRLLSRQVEAIVMLQLRAIGLGLAPATAGGMASGMAAAQGFAVAPDLPWLAPLRQDVVARAPDRVLATLRPQPLTPPPNTGGLDAALSAANGVIAAGNQVLDAIASHADSVLMRTRSDAYAQSLERCARELDALERAASVPADTAPMPLAPVRPRLEARWTVLDSLERVQLARANVTPFEIADLATWLGAGRLELRAPAALSDDPLLEAAQLARACVAPAGAPAGAPAAPVAIVRSGVISVLPGAGRDWRSARVFDAAGRCVRHLPAAGAGALAWDGRADDGRPVTRGDYWVLVQRANGTLTLRVIVLP